MNFKQTNQEGFSFVLNEAFNLLEIYTNFSKNFIMRFENLKKLNNDLSKFVMPEQKIISSLNNHLDEAYMFKNYNLLHKAQIKSPGIDFFNENANTQFKIESYSPEIKMVSDEVQIDTSTVIPKPNSILKKAKKKISKKHQVFF